MEGYDRLYMFSVKDINEKLKNDDWQWEDSSYELFDIKKLTLQKGETIDSMCDAIFNRLDAVQKLDTRHKIKVFCREIDRNYCVFESEHYREVPGLVTLEKRTITEINEWLRENEWQWDNSEDFELTSAGIQGFGAGPSITFNELEEELQKRQDEQEFCINVECTSRDFAFQFKITTYKRKEYLTSDTLAETIIALQHKWTGEVNLPKAATLKDPEITYELDLSSEASVKQGVEAVNAMLEDMPEDQVPKFHCVYSGIDGAKTATLYVWCLDVRVLSDEPVEEGGFVEWVFKATEEELNRWLRTHHHEEYNAWKHDLINATIEARKADRYYQKADTDELLDNLTYFAEAQDWDELKAVIEEIERRR